MYKEMANFQKSPPKDVDGVYEENSDFRGKITNRQGGSNMNYIDYCSVNFRRITSGNIPSIIQEADLQLHTLVDPVRYTTP